MSRSNSVSFDDFDPNDPNRNHNLWAVWAGGRFKTYTSRGPALNGFMSWPRAKLYEYVVGQGWVTRAVKDPASRNDTCDYCAQPGVKASHVRSWSSRWEWQRLGGKILSPPVLLYVCSNCQPIVAHA